VRGGRVDYVDKPHDVVHIPTDYLKEVPLWRWVKAGRPNRKGA
jgi:hypothetical protein